MSCDSFLSTVHSSRSSDHLCLSIPHVSTRLKFADRSFRNSFPRLWNSLSVNPRSFALYTYCSIAVTSSTPFHPFRALSLSSNQFLSCLKIHLFTLSYPPQFLCLPDLLRSFPTGQLYPVSHHGLTPPST